MKPLIGISCSLKQDDPVCDDGRKFDFVKQEYYRSVEANGGIPVLLPNVEQEATLLDFLSRIDGLLITGGEDVDPSWYGEENRFAGSMIHPRRDRVEIFLARKARERCLPVFGICRGVQVMNVAYGGSLHQDLSLRPGTGEHKVGRAYVYLDHPVKVLADTRIAQLAGREIVQVNSSHHQILNRIAPGFTVSATALDGVVEAIERFDSGEYLLGVQWHPEMTSDDALSAAIFRDFILSASQRK
ncbi:MAG: gamma-glutamyl-gamma-aminobutyrate hydrolase family protein [Acidobacteriota bacterium]|jgi:putative glutamine amidotransferase